MRTSGLFASIVALSIFGSMAHAQDSAIKPDSQATQSSRRSAVIGEVGDNTTASQEKKPQSVSIGQNVFQQSEPVVVARWDGGEMTNLEVSATLATRRPPNLRTLSPEQFAMLQRNQQIEVIKQLVWERLLLDEARQAGINEETPEVANVVAQQEENLLNRLYYENVVTPRLDNLAEQRARDFYQENLDEKFTQPAQTVLRALHVSTYEMVTAEVGDTLEGLATQISGDANKSSLIRQALPPFYHRQVPTEIEDKVLSSPLKGGEVLYVPVGEDAVSSATVLAETLRRKLFEGKSIDELMAETKAEDFAVSATQPVQISERAGYWDELTAAAASLEGTSISEVIKTPTGLNILVVEDRRSTQVLPFEMIKEKLVQEMTADETTQRETVEKTREETLQKLWEKYNVQVNDEVLGLPNVQGSDPLSTDTVIVSVGDDFTYNLEQFLVDLRLTGKDWGQLTKQQRMEVLKVAPRITNYLTAREARELGLHKTDAFQEKMKGILESQIVAVYKRQKEDPEARRVTDEELRAFYNDNLDKYTSAAQVTIRELSKRINMTLPPEAKAKEIEEARKSLAEIRSRIKNEEDFAQLARRESEAISTRSRGGLIGTVPEDFRGEAFRNQIRQLKEGEISEPFLYGSEVMIVRLDDRLAPTVQPFENVRRQVMQDYAATMPQQLRNQELESALKDASFKITF